MIPQDYIAIEGVIGAGKTTLARLIAERIQARLLLEEVEENPFLELFYKDMRRYAFQTQMFFVTGRYRQQCDFMQGDVFFQKTVSDYLFQKDRIFANITLDDRELDLYNRIVPVMERDIPVRTSSSTCKRVYRCFCTGSRTAVGPTSGLSSPTTFRR